VWTEFVGEENQAVLGSRVDSSDLSRTAQKALSGSVRLDSHPMRHLNRLSGHREWMGSRRALVLDEAA